VLRARLVAHLAHAVLQRELLQWELTERKLTARPSASVALLQRELLQGELPQWELTERTLTARPSASAAKHLALLAHRIRRAARGQSSAGTAASNCWNARPVARHADSTNRTFVVMLIAPELAPPSRLSNPLWMPAFLVFP
jgi:hypothetical protein